MPTAVAFAEQSDSFSLMSERRQILATENQMFNLTAGVVDIPKNKSGPKDRTKAKGRNDRAERSDYQVQSYRMLATLPGVCAWRYTPPQYLAPLVGVTSLEAMYY